MARNTLYTILLFSIALFSFSSCSGSDDVNYLAEGEWIVYERGFTCSDKDLEERIKETIKYATAINDYVVNFSSGTAGENGLEYQENIFDKGTIEEDLPYRVLKGRYLQTNYESIKIAIQNLGATVGAWEYDTSVIDINREHVHMKQSLTADDIEKFCIAYDFGVIFVDEGVTAELSTKAVKMNR